MHPTDQTVQIRVTIWPKDRPTRLTLAEDPILMTLTSLSAVQQASLRTGTRATPSLSPSAKVPTSSLKVNFMAIHYTIDKFPLLNSSLVNTATMANSSHNMVTSSHSMATSSHNMVTSSHNMVTSIYKTIPLVASARVIRGPTDKVLLRLLQGKPRASAKVHLGPIRGRPRALAVPLAFLLMSSGGPGDSFSRFDHQILLDP